MSKTVRDVMSGQLYAVLASEPPAEVLNQIIARKITAAPVIDGAGKPVGLVSLRDFGAKNGESIAEFMTSPAVTVRASAALADAGRLLVERGLHRLVVVDDAGRAIAVVSALDVIRGLLP
jgi:CBS domain-containing protein